MTQDKLTFEDLPAAVAQLLIENQEIKQLLKALTISSKQDDSFPEVMGVRKAAEFLKIKTGTLYNMVSSRQIPHSKKGSLKFSKTELLDWLGSGKRLTTEEESQDAEKTAIKLFKQ